MKAYIWKTGRQLSPFQDPVGEVLILSKPLRVHQANALRSCGLEVAETADPCSITEEEYLLVADDLYLSRVALERFLKRIRKTRQPGACALESGPFVEFTGFAQDHRMESVAGCGKPVHVFGLSYCRGPIPAPAFLDSLPPVVITARQKPLPIDPRQFFPSTVEVNFSGAYTDAILIHVRHWVHLWLANLFCLGSELLDAFTRNKLMFLVRALSALSFNKYRMFSRFVIKGKGCDIHPSAVVEGCILGNRVSIGAFSLVRGCILADGVKVNEHSIVALSVLGEGASTSPRGWTKFSVVYPNSNTPGHALQGCLVGRNVFMATPSYLYDLKIKGTIKVKHEGRLVDTKMSFLGSCVGHNAIVGPDTWIASGSEIPNGAVLVKKPSEIISSVPEDLPPGEYLTCEDATLHPVRSLPATPAKKGTTAGSEASHPSLAWPRPERKE